MIGCSLDKMIYKTKNIITRQFGLFCEQRLCVDFRGKILLAEVLVLKSRNLFLRSAIFVFWAKFNIREL